MERATGVVRRLFPATYGGGGLELVEDDRGTYLRILDAGGEYAGRLEGLALLLLAESVRLAAGGKGRGPG